jgi:hypothetical protein
MVFMVSTTIIICNDVGTGIVGWIAMTHNVRVLGEEADK